MKSAYGKRRLGGAESTLLAHLLALVLVLVAAAGSEVRAQSGEPAAAAPVDGKTSAPAAVAPAAPPADTRVVEDYSKPMGPPDPFNRGTPRGSMYGFLTAARKGDYEAAAQYLDLRRLSPEEQERGPQLARQLKAVLDQTLWIDFSTLSDRNEGFGDDGLPAWQDRLGDVETREGLVTLLIQRVPRRDDGARIWQVAAVTVGRTAELYDEFGPRWLEARLPAVFFSARFLGMELWQWSGLALLPIAAWLISLLLAGGTIGLLSRIWLLRGQKLHPGIARVVRGPVRLAITVLVFTIGRRYLALELPVQILLQVLERLLWVVSAAWLVFRFMDVIVLGLRVRAEERGSVGVIPVLIPVSRFAKVMIVLIGGLGVLGTLGVNVTAAVAGLGVGGIAVALAAQKTIENLFGGISLFADRPVRVGDFCRYGDQVGTVEEIGLRSTRIRTLDRTVVTIPNAEFSNLKLENYAHRDRVRLVATLGLRYETTAEQLRYALTRVRQILVAHPRVLPDPLRVRFVGFGAYSLDVEVVAYVDTQDWNEFLAIREDIYLLFMGAIKQAGTGFAFPSTTMYLGRDDGLDASEIEQAEAQVGQWREKGALPFPNLSSELIREAEDTLDWPPPGSADSPSRPAGDPRGSAGSPRDE